MKSSPESSLLYQLGKDLVKDDPMEGYFCMLAFELESVMQVLIKNAGRDAQDFLRDGRKLPNLLKEPIEFNFLLRLLSNHAGFHDNIVKSGGSDTPESLGETIFHICARYKHYDLLNYLIKTLSEHDPENRGYEYFAQFVLNCKNKLGQTVYSYIDIEDLSANQNESDLLDAIDSVKDKISASDTIVNDKQETHSCKFEKRNPNMDRDIIYISQLHRAAIDQDVAMLTRFLIEGMDPNVRERSQNVYDSDAKTHTPLHYWVDSKSPQPNEKVLTTLLKFGADLEAKSRYGDSPLKLALNSPERSNYLFVPLLLKHGARLNSEENLVSLLKLVDEFDVHIELPLSALDMTNPDFKPDIANVTPAIFEAYLVVMEVVEKENSGEVTLDLHKIISETKKETPRLKAQQEKIKRELAEAHERIARLEAELQKHHDNYVQKSTAKKDDEKEPEASEESKVSTLSAKLRNHDYYKVFLQQEIFEKIKNESVSSRYDEDTQKEIKQTITDLDEVIDECLKDEAADEVTDQVLQTVNEALINKIQDDVLKRDNIKNQHWFKAILKGIVGVLAAVFSIGIPVYKQASRERFTAKFFKSHACYEFTLLKQQMDKKALTLS